MKTLEDYRKERGVSKRAFARWLEIPYTTYLRYEANINRAPFEEVIKICAKLEIPTDSFAQDFYKKHSKA